MRPRGCHQHSYQPLAYGTGIGVWLSDSGEEGGCVRAYRHGGYDGGVEGFIGCGIGIGEGIGPDADEL